MTTQELVDTPEKYAEAKRYLNGRTDDLVMDTETNGLSFVDNHMVGTGLLAGDRAFYLPFRHAEGRNLPESLIGDMCETILRRDRKQVGYHYGFDIKMMRKEGMPLPNNFDDAMLRAHVLNENEPSFKMENVATKYVDKSASAAEDELTDMLVERFGGARSTAKKNLWRLSGEETLRYGTQDLITTRALRDFQRPHLDLWELAGIADEVEDFQSTIAEVELFGCHIDQELLAVAGPQAKVEADRLEALIQDSAGYPINPRSPKQLKTWLRLANTKKETLLTIADDDPRAQNLLDYRGWQKVEGTYYRPIAAGIDEDGFVHPDLRVTGTVAGRLSCQGIALQGVPRSVDDIISPYYGVKRLFNAPAGYEIIEIDLAQAEIVLMAHYSRDPKLLEILAKGLSMHDVVAAEQGVPRRVAKALNFSAQYGIGEIAFAKTYGYTRKQSAEYLADYHKLFAGVRRFSKQCERIAKKRGHIRTWSGRARHFNVPQAKIHSAANNVVQGGIACAVRRAMPIIRRQVPEFIQCLSVHDSVLGYAKSEHAVEIGRSAAKILSAQFDGWCTVDMRTDIKIGANWAEAQEVAA
jgi:DNA polymerase-1